MSDLHRYPDFIIAGAPRSATTWLYALADSHSEIAMAKPVRPEPKFFLIDDLYERGLAHYASHWFDALPNDRVLGEKSTNYLESAFVAQRIWEALPNVRLIFVLRDPVERAHSNYIWTRQSGLETETFERALDLEEERERQLPDVMRYARPFSYFSRGLYADHLTRFYNLFPRERILVLRTEDVVGAPRAVADRFQRFIGVTPRPELADHVGPLNAVARAGDADAMRPQTRRVLIQRYQAPNQRLAELLGPGFKIWIQ
jgi:hypothetical protein